MAFELGSARERFNLYNSLACLIKALEGICTTIDLRNDSFITGLVDNVDGYMNVIIKDAIFVNPRGEQYSFESFFIHARNIRYVHIPESMPIVNTMKQQLKTMNPTVYNPKPKEKKTFKGKRAMASHMQTVASLGKGT